MRWKGELEWVTATIRPPLSASTLRFIREKIVANVCSKNSVCFICS